MKVWISKAEALKIAQVSVFDAKRYLLSFSRFIPPNRIIVKGDRVSPLVPQLFIYFKTLENSGMSIMQIEQAVAELLSRDKPYLINRSPEASFVSRADMYAIFTGLEKVVHIQAGMQDEVLKLVQQFREEITELQCRLTCLEDTLAKAVPDSRQEGILQEQMEGGQA